MHLMTLTPTRAKSLGTDAYVFGFPLLLTAATMRRTTNAHGTEPRPVQPNRFAHVQSFPDPELTALVGANADTLYSLAWLDLARGPVLLDLPDVGRRSYLISLLDAWSNVFASLGPRTADPGASSHVIVGPGWSGELPQDVLRLDAPTNRVWVICHLHTEGGDDLHAGRAIQRSLTLEPLSDGDGRQAPDAPAVDLPGDPEPSAHRHLMALQAERFLGELSTEMRLNPPSKQDRPTLVRLAEIGVRPGMPLVWSKLPGDVRNALEAGVEEGKREVSLPPGGREENGWQALHEGLGDFGGDYLRRAQVANLALGIAHPADAVFPLTAIDGDGQRLNGAHLYTLRFEPGGSPPVNALWSLALYDMDQLPVPNSIDRYALGDRDELELELDGSLEIVIQHERPEGSDANWLPAPEGDFNLMLHMYWPDQSVLDGSWKIPPVRRVD